MLKLTFIAEFEEATETSTVIIVKAKHATVSELTRDYDTILGEWDTTKEKLDKKSKETLLNMKLVTEKKANLPNCTPNLQRILPTSNIQ